MTSLSTLNLLILSIIFNKPKTTLIILANPHYKDKEKSAKPVLSLNSISVSETQTNFPKY